ncbi:MAG: FadR/GntR family transcriptional regulator [Geminicoccaceae bacterium]
MRSRRGIHGEVVDRLGRDIMGGTWVAGARLPNEAELCTRFGVSRTALREGLRVLAAKGLISARPRIGMTVRAKADWNLLDLDLLTWQREVGHPDADLVRSLTEARGVIEPAAAFLAATRATPEDIERIDAAWHGMASAAQDDIDACCRADVAFHAEVLRASHNVVFAQLMATLAAALEMTFRISTGATQTFAYTLDVHKGVLDAIRRRDPAGAEACMRELLAVARRDLSSAYEGLADT